MGKIVLRFGASGAEGEAPLGFTAGALNLFVGTNNAGKSLILRELSGLNPRERRDYYSPFREVEDERRIVADVEWDVATVREREAIVLDRVRKSDAWGPLKPGASETVLSALEEAPAHLDTIREELVAQLVELLYAQANADTQRALGLFKRNGFNPMGVSELVVHGAIGLSLQPGLLSEEQVVTVRGTLLAAWERVGRVFAPLGIDVSLTPGDLDAVRGVLLHRFQEWAIRFGAAPQQAIEAPTQEHADLVEKLSTVLRWFLNPAPLGRVSKLARDSRAEMSWSNHSLRSKVAGGWLYLDGLTRLGMTAQAPLRPYDDVQAGELPISTLLRDPERREQLRTLVYDALGRYLVIDMATATPDAMWRLSTSPPLDGVETGYTASAVGYHNAADPLSERSDGNHAYVGMLAAILSKSHPCVFIDEPEAFLHPPLVRKLARQLGDIARKTGTQFFIATHSPDLVASCAASGSANIVRLTHDDARSTARLLDARALRELALDPLLRSEATLSALFQDGAVICEAAADRVLYQEINERLLAFESAAGVESCVYLNAQNWQTTARMAAPLRRMGVAAVIVLDADVLFQGDLKKVLDAAQLPDLIQRNLKQTCTQLRATVVARLGVPDKDGKKKAELKRDILRHLNADERESFEDAVDKLASYGVFIVPVGELEDWFPEFGFNPAYKAEWLPQVLKRLGADPEVAAYVRPGPGDIWAFARRLNAWIRDSSRKGTSPE
ncbi:MAG: AAA family ATPase [Pseudomonadota bacterium]|nr:AAA family ATPase [Pseudomonadota bacterium]